MSEGIRYQRDNRHRGDHQIFTLNEPLRLHLSTFSAQKRNILLSSHYSWLGLSHVAGTGVMPIKVMTCHDMACQVMVGHERANWRAGEWASW